eukprot:3386519-Rhodomonas_salina.1
MRRLPRGQLPEFVGYVRAVPEWDDGARGERGGRGVRVQARLHQCARVCAPSPGPSCLRACYNMPGTEVAYGTIQCA